MLDIKEGTDLDIIEKYVGQKWVMDYADVTAAWLERDRWSGHGEGPPFIKIGRQVRYRVKDVIKWLENKRKISSTTEDRKAVQK